MNLAKPSAFVPPWLLRGVDPSALEPIPNLPRVAYPKTLRGEPIEIDPYDIVTAGRVDDLVREVERKLCAEDARIRRLLPPPPFGFEWRGEIATNTDYNFDAFTACETVRLRYRLVEIDSAP